MKRAEQPRIAQLLADVPAGSVALTQHSAAGPDHMLLTEQFSAQTDGRGRVASYAVFPGANVSYTVFSAQEVCFHHAAEPAILELFHCRSGRVGWNMQGGTAIYLGAGDLTAHSAACCADSAMMFPLGYAAGISISVDLPRLAANCPAALQQAGFDAQAMQAALCAGSPAAVPASPALEHIFAPLYAAPDNRRQAYLMLKVQELLLYLMDFQPGAQALTQYHAEQTELIKQIHRQLTENLSQRFTIEELSRQYLINTSTLKEVFKAVYGLPIATYMKQYRVQQAMQLLRETDLPVSEIARQVGYGTQGKFSNAFRDVAHMLPTAYRREHCGSAPMR